jgi:hypothetical protein
VEEKNNGWKGLNGTRKEARFWITKRYISWSRWGLDEMKWTFNPIREKEM